MPDKPRDPLVELARLIGESDPFAGSSLEQRSAELKPQADPDPTDEELRRRTREVLDKVLRKLPPWLIRRR